MVRARALTHTNQCMLIVTNIYLYLFLETVINYNRCDKHFRKMRCRGVRIF